MTPMSRYLGTCLLILGAVSGCDDGELGPEPELLLIDTEIDCGISRRHDAVPSVSVSVQNTGDAPLEIFEVIPPAGLVAMDVALTLASGETRALAFECPTDQPRLVSGDVTIRTNERLIPEVFVPVTGEVTPYIRITPEPHPEVDAAVEQILAREGIVGLGVGIIRSQDIVYLKGFGLEDREEVIDVDPEETLFRWASVSKGITGLASVIALHTGALSLDADIRDLDDDFRPPTHYLPSRCDEMSCAVALAPSEQVLSPRRLLSHTAGIQHYTNGLANPVPPNELTSDPAHNSGFAWALEYWVSSPLIAKPGVAFSYSTFGSNLAGAALEAAVGVSFADYVDEHIAQVIGMRTLRPDYHWEQSPRRAAGYYRDGRITRRDSDTDVSWKLPGGGFRSSVGDLARYCGALMGSVVLPEDLRDGELWAPVPPATHYALGFGVSDDIVEHGGAQEKTRTYLRIRRNENVCLVLMTNSTWVDPEALAIEIDQALVL